MTKSKVKISFLNSRWLRNFSPVMFYWLNNMEQDMLIQKILASLFVNSAKTISLFYEVKRTVKQK